MTSRLRWLIAAAIVAGGIAVHLPNVLAADCLNSDAAVVLLMARHFAQGEFHPYYWDQRYMGVLDQLLMTPFALVGLAVPAVAAWAAVAVTMAQAAACAVLARRWGGAGWLAALLVAAPSARVAREQAQLVGARGLATLLCLGALLLATGTARRRWLAAGALAGIALYGDHLHVMWALPIGLLALRERGAWRSYVAGAAPFVLADLATIVLLGHGATARPYPPSAALLLRNLEFLQRLVAPSLAVGLAAAAVVGGALLVTRRRFEALALAAVPVVAAGTFLLGAMDLSSIRYLIPALPALAVIVALGAGTLPRVLRPLALAVALPLALWTQDPTAPRGRARGAACRDNDAAVDAALREAGAGGVLAGYWDAYHLALVTDERIPFGVIEGWDRRPDWTAAARAARRVAYLARTRPSILVVVEPHAGGMPSR